MSNELIPLGDFVPGLLFQYNTGNTSDTTVNPGYFSASLISGPEDVINSIYTIYVSTDDFFGESHAHTLESLKNAINKIYIGSTNQNKTLFNVVLDTSTASQFKFTGTLVGGKYSSISGLSTVEFLTGGSSDLDVKKSCRITTTANLDLSGPETIDEVSIIAGDRVLVKDQSTASENGIYICQTGAWTRADDFDNNSEVTAGAFTFIEEGTINKDTGWVLTTNNPITVGTTALTFTQFSARAAYTAGALLDLDGTTFNVDLSELPTSTTNGDGQYFAVIDGSNNQNQLTKGNIGLSGFNNDAGFGVGDITGVTAGIGLSGVGVSGDISLAVDLNELTTTTDDNKADYLVVVDGAVSGDTSKISTEHVKLSGFNNDSAWAAGTVTSVGGTGTKNGLTLTGTVTGSGNLTLGGTLAINDDQWSGNDLSVVNGGTGASSFTSNAILTGNNTSAIQAESTLTYASETLTIGADDAGEAIITRRTHSDEAGGGLSIKGGDATGTSKAGGNLELYAGRGTGSGAGGDIIFKVANAGSSSGSSLNSLVTALTISDDKSATFEGHIIPGADETYDLGSETNKFRDLYLNGSSIILGNTKMTNVGGDLELSDISNSNTKRKFKMPNNNVTHDMIVTNIPNTKLANSDITIGSTTIALGATSAALTGLTSVDMSSSTESESSPLFTISNTQTTATSKGEIRFIKDVTSADGGDIGHISFYAKDASDNTAERFCQILGEVEESGHGTEGGKLTLSVASHGGGLQPGLIIEDGDAEHEVDVTIGNTATSITTITGILNATNYQISGAQGDDGQVLTSTGSGVAWEDAAGGVTVSDSSANTDFPVVFNNESNTLLDDTGAFTYNPSTGTLAATSLDISGNLTITGDIILDDGGSLKEAGGTTALRFDGSGHITKIGQDSPSSGQFLKWDGGKVVWGAGDITGVTAGTGLTGGGTSGAVTLNVSGLTVAELAAGSLQLSSESFADSDTTLMASAAIQDKILSYGYTTNTGDITGVTAGNGLNGGGNTGAVTLHAGGGTGIIANANDIQIDPTYVCTVATTQTLTNKTLTSPVFNSGISGTAFKDEDNMSSDSATAVASQQSIKAYVDSSAPFIAFRGYKHTSTIYHTITNSWSRVHPSYWYLEFVMPAGKTKMHLEYSIKQIFQARYYNPYYLYQWYVYESPEIRRGVNGSNGYCTWPGLKNGSSSYYRSRQWFYHASSQQNVNQTVSLAGQRTIECSYSTGANLAFWEAGETYRVNVWMYQTHNSQSSYYHDWHKIELGQLAEPCVIKVTFT